MHLIVAWNTEHSKLHYWTFSLYVTIIKTHICTTAMFKLVSMTCSNVSSLVQYFCSIAGYLCTVHCLIQHFISVVTFNTALYIFQTDWFLLKFFYSVTYRCMLIDLFYSVGNILVQVAVCSVLLHLLHVILCCRPVMILVCVCNIYTSVPDKRYWRCMHVFRISQLVYSTVHAKIVTNTQRGVTCNRMSSTLMCMAACARG